jgi:hypothetical protein
VAAGTVLVWVVGQARASQVWGVSGYDRMTHGAVIAILIAVVFRCAYIPPGLRDFRECRRFSVANWGVGDADDLWGPIRQTRASLCTSL